MILIVVELFMVLSAIGILVLESLAANAPEGYEDGTGFHTIPQT